MFGKFLRGAAVAMMALGLGGCVSAYKPAEPYFIENVTVAKASPAIGSPGTAPRIERGVESYTRAQPRTGAPKQLDIVVTELRKKNAAQALLIGDTNRLSAEATITGANGVEWNETVIVLTDVAFQGVLGAVIAASRQADGVETELIDRFVVQMTKLAYGGKLPARTRAPTARPQRGRTVPVS